MFERFTASARQVVVAGQERARALGAREIRPEHLLLAISAQPDTAGSQALQAEGVTHEALTRAVTSIAPDLAARDDAAALKSLGIDLDAVRRQAEAAFGPGALDRPRPQGRGLFGRRSSTPSGHLRLSSGVKRALSESVSAAQAARSGHLGVEHLLLGLLAADDDAASRAVQSLGVSPAAVRRRLQEHLSRAA